MDTVILSDWLAVRLATRRDRGDAEPVYRQLLRLLQQAILTSQLPPGTKMPDLSKLRLPKQ